MLLGLLLPFVFNIRAENNSESPIKISFNGIGLNTFSLSNFIPTSRDEITPYFKGLMAGFNTGVLQGGINNYVAQHRLSNPILNEAKDVAVVSLTAEGAVFAQQAAKELFVGSGEINRKLLSTLAEEGLKILWLKEWQ